MLICSTSIYMQALRVGQNLQLQVYYQNIYLIVVLVLTEKTIFYRVIELILVNIAWYTLAVKLHII